MYQKQRRYSQLLECCLYQHLKEKIIMHQKLCSKIQVMAFSIFMHSKNRGLLKNCSQRNFSHKQLVELSQCRSAITVVIKSLSSLLLFQPNYGSMTIKDARNCQCGKDHTLIINVGFKPVDLQTVPNSMSNCQRSANCNSTIPSNFQYVC